MRKKFDKMTENIHNNISKKKEFICNFISIKVCIYIFIFNAFYIVF